MKRSGKLFPILIFILLLSLCFDQKTDKKNLKDEEKELIKKRNNQLIDSLLIEYKAKKIDLWEDDFYTYTFELQEKIMEKKLIGFEFYYGLGINQDIFKIKNEYILEIQVGFRGKSSLVINIDPSLFEKIKNTQHGFIIIRINDVQIEKSVKVYHNNEEIDVYPSNHISFNGTCLEYISL